MSDDRDETRPFAPTGADTRPDDAPKTGPDDSTRLHDAAVDDATQADIPRLDDATQADAPRVEVDDATRVEAAAAGGRSADAGETVADPDQLPPVRDAAAARKARPDATSVMPAADDWAPGRGNPAWTGRAEVRAPRPGGATYTQQDEWAAPPGREPRDRWWMPIVVGIIALVLLAALGWGIYLIVQNSDDDSPAPAVSTPATQAPAPTVTATATTPPTTAPTTAPPPTTAAATTEPPAAVEVQIPALAGLSLEEAQAALARSGLRSYKAIYRTDDAPPGTVIGSDPAEGQEVPPDTTVTLVISQGNGAPQTTATTTGPTQPGN